MLPAADIRIGIIGGTGLGDALVAAMEPSDVQTHEIETPFGATSSPITTGAVRDVPIALLARHGSGHLLRPAAIPYRANIYALKALGCTHIVASGATGSLRTDIAPGEIVLCDQLIDRTQGRPRTFYERAAVHVEFAEPFCPVMRSWLLGAAQSLEGPRVHEAGVYVCMEGPSFSTRAESYLHRMWGADVVGMTALPEARLAREAELAYVLVALPTDYDCWRPRIGESDGQTLLAEIMVNLRQSTEGWRRLLKRALHDVSVLREQPSPAHDALKLAIWSEKSLVPEEEVARLGVLWGRYF